MEKQSKNSWTHFFFTRLNFCSSPWYQRSNYAGFLMAFEDTKIIIIIIITIIKKVDQCLYLGNRWESITYESTDALLCDIKEWYFFYPVSRFCYAGCTWHSFLFGFCIWINHQWMEFYLHLSWPKEKILYETALWLSWIKFNHT